MLKLHRQLALTHAWRQWASHTSASKPQRLAALRAQRKAARALQLRALRAWRLALACLHVCLSPIFVVQMMRSNAQAEHFEASSLVVCTPCNKYLCVTC